jgi:hypothetical protein
VSTLGTEMMILEEGTGLNIFLARVEHIDGEDGIGFTSTSSHVCEHELKINKTNKRLAMHFNFITLVFRFCCECTAKSKARNMISSFLF